MLMSDTILILIFKKTKLIAKTFLFYMKKSIPNQ